MRFGDRPPPRTRAICAAYPLRDAGAVCPPDPSARRVTQCVSLRVVILILGRNDISFMITTCIESPGTSTCGVRVMIDEIDCARRAPLKKHE